ncbi:hypothetical protein FRC16_010842 [Serendipita sp. 398]|nr:hypothetical protein FRC16_010842 [Serendipita sp. 398]
MYCRGLLQIGPAQIAIECDFSITIRLKAYLFDRCQVLYSIREEVRMGVTKDERTKFHDRNEPSEILYFCVWIPAIENSREVEKLCSLVYFSPEPFLERLLGRTLDCNLFDEVKVGQDADYLGKAMCLQDIEEFEGFLGRKCSVDGESSARKLTCHLEPKARVDHKKHKVGNFTDIYHRIEVIITFDDGEPLLFAGDERDGAFDL